jgi:hypothetical protein
MAFVLAGEMAVAYWISHFLRDFFPSTTAAMHSSYTASSSCISSSLIQANGA